MIRGLDPVTRALFWLAAVAVAMAALSAIETEIVLWRLR